MQQGDKSVVIQSCLKNYQSRNFERFLFLSSIIWILHNTHRNISNNTAYIFKYSCWTIPYLLFVCHLYVLFRWWTTSKRGLSSCYRCHSPSMSSRYGVDVRIPSWVSGTQCRQLVGTGTSLFHTAALDEFTHFLFVEISIVFSFHSLLTVSLFYSILGPLGQMDVWCDCEGLSDLSKCALMWKVCRQHQIKSTKILCYVKEKI